MSEFPIAIRILAGFGVRGHDRAFLKGDMSPHSKAASCRRTPKRRHAAALHQYAGTLYG